MFEEINKKISDLGAHGVSTAKVADVVFDKGFREACVQNYCGKYGKSWTCPPLCGDIEDMIEVAKQYTDIVVFNYIGELEDSYDYEGMMEAGSAMAKITHAVHEEFYPQYPQSLYLSGGACRICEKCTAPDGAPCRFPDKALKSLESYGIAVSQLAEICGMKYINGQDTVTYFSAILF